MAMLSIVSAPSDAAAAVARIRVEHVAGSDMGFSARHPPRRTIKRRLPLAAHLLGEWAARVEAAAGRRVDRVWRVAGDRRLVDAPGRVHRRPRGEQWPGIRVARVL